MNHKDRATNGKVDRIQGTNYKWTRRSSPLTLRVIYHHGLTDEIHDWSAMVGWSTALLRLKTEAAIRDCHHAALIQSRAVGRHPDVYGLGLGPLIVCYTVEPEAVVVRGYAPNLPVDQVEEEIAGHYFCEFSWFDASWD
jgi:hypothetical protein